MSEFLGAALHPVPPDGTAVLIRLVLAMLAGGMVTLIYRFTRAADETAPSFTVTLVLLAILIAMVTQVIGDNVARAFSLVGALSIVRFRTVVRDTQDTAYVIFAVAVGMAVGAGHPGLAVSGLGVIAFAAFVMRKGVVAASVRHDPFLLHVRLALGHDPAILLAPVFDAYLVARHLVSIGTAKQGLAIELSYRAALRNEEAAAELVERIESRRRRAERIARAHGWTGGLRAGGAMPEQAVTAKGRRLRDWVTITQGALLLVAIILIGTLISGAGRPRAVRAQGPGGFGGPGGPQGFGRGPMGQPEQKLVPQFDKNKDDRLDTDERKAARAWLAENGGGGRGFGGGRRGGGRGMAAASPGRALKPADVKAYGTEPLYDPAVLRTMFLQFESDDWEQELAAFNNTDVDVPAVATVDGRAYRNVGVHFRGMSSFYMVPAGSKRSLNLTFDFVDAKQSLLGYRTLNLLNVNSDPTFVRAMLYSDIARAYFPAPKTNYMRVVINGESWGVFINAQQYNKDFLRDYFKTEQGARWKVPGNPGGRGGMEYWGDDPSAYKRSYDIRTKDDPKVWASLIQMFKVLNETPPDKLEAALSPLLDIDGALRFLAVDNALVNTDGYWTRASDYSIYQDVKGRFHIIPHDMNEALINEGGGRGRGPGGPPPDFVRGGPGGPGGPPPGFGGPDGPPPGGMPPGMGRGGRGFGPGGGGPTLDPLIGLDDPSKPLRSKLLAVPGLRTRYLAYVREIAEKWLDWKKLGPMARTYQDLIREEVKLDTRKLYSTEAFETGLETGDEALKKFVDERREYLLKVTDPKTQLK